MRVYCTQWASCGWKGMRKGSREEAVAKRCPKCGKEVTA